MMTQRKNGRSAIVVPAIVFLLFGATLLSAAAIALGLTISPVTVQNTQPPIFPDPSSASHAKGGSTIGPIFGSTVGTSATSGHHQHHHSLPPSSTPSRGAASTVTPSS